ncbi:conserved hypothetical protein [Leptospira interrogans serovar Copenhageni str. Fiocruz L1-130]|uniref:Uncharacterized protein n=1 Tax=Leptospira interrogans serogroup Icterohaemorrhagiae serovar copenhageni (strain Fiocruz L1-130) TaxID=267671 RepID=Q72V83_LEPIC|nr:conserved hypothetical protein [Leptospira interrogans serovar Copenhageni str. Fiocruz L1-130]
MGNLPHPRSSFEFLTYRKLSETLHSNQLENHLNPFAWLTKFTPLQILFKRDKNEYNFKLRNSSRFRSDFHHDRLVH